MAIVNLGSIKFNWKGAYAGGTAYAVDDVVSYNGSSYVCTAASTGNLPTDTNFWDQMSSAGTNGTDGTDLGTTLTTQGDIVYRNASGLARLGAGTAGQALITNGTGANPSWGTISSGTYSVHRIDTYNYQVGVTSSSSTQEYIDIAGGNAVSFQPTSTNDFVFLSHSCRTIQGGNDHGLDVFLMMKEGSASIGSGDTRLNYDGNYAFYTEDRQDLVINKNLILPCTGLNTSSTYYVEQAGANHNANACQFNTTSTNADSSGRIRHTVSLVHYKAN